MLVPQLQPVRVQMVQQVQMVWAEVVREAIRRMVRHFREAREVLVVFTSLSILIYTEVRVATLMARRVRQTPRCRDSMAHRARFFRILW